MEKTDLKTILVVDDDLGDKIYLRKNLSQNLLRKNHSQNYVIIEASNGDQAVDLARSYNPALILMDIMMPNMDGYTACYMIKRDPRTAGIPVVMITGLKSELNMRLADEIGAIGYLTKPINQQELINIIDQLLCSN